MKIKTIVFFLLFISAPLTGYSNDKILLCDKDITDANHPFYWDNLQLIVRKQGQETKQQIIKSIYEQLYDKYNKQLTEQQKSLPLVKTFVALQKDIIDKSAPANLSLKPGLDGVELSNGNTKIADIPCEDKDKDYLITITYVSIAYKKIHDEKWEELRSIAARRIGHLEQQYDNWFTNGLPMWPLETWINGKFLDISDAVEPQKWQLVFLRPSVGLGVNTADGIKDSNMQATLGIEPIGYVSYTKDDYSEYWGASVLVTGGDDVGFGYGLLARYNNYVLGVTRRNNNDKYGVSNNDTYLFVGVDLYKMIHEKEERFRQQKIKADERFNAIKQQLGDAMQQLSSTH